MWHSRDCSVSSVIIDLKCMVPGNINIIRMVYWWFEYRYPLYHTKCIKVEAYYTSIIYQHSIANMSERKLVLAIVYTISRQHGDRFTRKLLFCQIEIPNKVGRRKKWSPCRSNWNCSLSQNWQWLSSGYLFINNFFWHNLHLFCIF